MAKQDNTQRNEEIIRLHTVEKLSYGQIKVRLGVSRNTVAGVLHRACVRGERPYKGGGNFPCVDILGQRFGRWTVIRKTPERASTGHIMWLCKCDCGTFREVASASLRRGDTKSCGCLLREYRNRGRSEYVPERLLGKRAA